MSYVAISTVQYPAEARVDIHAAGLEMLPLARSLPGHISVAFHQSSERNETMMYWEWASAEDHEACMQSNARQDIMAKYGAAFAREGVEFSISTYERLG